jgi:hypothetical protein
MGNISWSVITVKGSFIKAKNNNNKSKFHVDQSDSFGNSVNHPKFSLREQ